MAGALVLVKKVLVSSLRVVRDQLRRTAANLKPVSGYNQERLVIQTTAREALPRV